MKKTFSLQFGLLALVGSMAGAACTSDDAGDTPAQGGSSGAGGSTAGKGGAGGSTGGKGGTGATGGTAGKGGSGGGAGTGGGGTGGSGASGNGGGSGEGFGGAEGGADSGGEGGQAVVAGAGGSSGASGSGGAAGAACNTLVNDGPQVSEEETSGTQPTPSGGTLPDGTYVLTRRQDWDGSCGCIEQRKFVFSQDGGHVELVTQSDDEPAMHASGDVTFENDQLTITFTCGAAEYVGQSLTVGYTVTPGTPLTYQTWDTNNGHHQLETYEQQ